jgi:hypothetical protein
MGDDGGDGGGLDAVSEELFKAVANRERLKEKLADGENGPEEIDEQLQALADKLDGLQLDPVMRSMLGGHDSPSSDKPKKPFVMDLTSMKFDDLPAPSPSPPPAPVASPSPVHDTHPARRVISRLSEYRGGRDDEPADEDDFDMWAAPKPRRAPTPPVRRRAPTPPVSHGGSSRRAPSSSGGESARRAAGRRRRDEDEDEGNRRQRRRGAGGGHSDEGERRRKKRKHHRRARTPSLSPPPARRSPYERERAVEPEPEPEPEPVVLNDFQEFMYETHRETEMLEKSELLARMQQLEREGFPAVKKMTLNTPLDDIRYEVYRQTREFNKTKSLKSMRNYLVTASSFIELANDHFNPFELQLSGFSNAIMMNIEDYDSTLLSLHHKYSGRGGDMAPEWKLAMSLTFAAICHHTSGVAARPRSNGRGGAVNGVQRMAGGGKPGGGGLGGMFAGLNPFNLFSGLMRSSAPAPAPVPAVPSAAPRPMAGPPSSDED